MSETDLLVGDSAQITDTVFWSCQEKTDCVCSIVGA